MGSVQSSRMHLNTETIIHLSNDGLSACSKCCATTRNSTNLWEHRMLPSKIAFQRVSPMEHFQNGRLSCQQPISYLWPLSMVHNAPRWNIRRRNISARNEQRLNRRKKSSQLMTFLLVYCACCCFNFIFLGPIIQCVSIFALQ